MPSDEDLSALFGEGKGQACHVLRAIAAITAYSMTLPKHWTGLLGSLSSGAGILETGAHLRKLVNKLSEEDWTLINKKNESTSVEMTKVIMRDFSNRLPWLMLDERSALKKPIQTLCNILTHYVELHPDKPMIFGEETAAATTDLKALQVSCQEFLDGKTPQRSL